MIHHVDVAGSSVAYRVDGAGPALVLVHGTGGDSESNWALLVDRLSQAHTVIRPDYSGSGGTVDDGQPLTVALLAAQVVAAAQDAGATRFDLVGFSLGAAVATYIAAEYPDRVRTVTLLAGLANGTDTRSALQFERWRDLIGSDRRSMARVMFLTGFSPDFLAAMDFATVQQFIQQTMETVNWDGMARQVALDMVLDVRDQARRIAKPTLVIGCTHDHMVPPAHARELADLIPGARYLQIETGHLGTLERPDQIAQAVLDHVSTAA